MNGIMKYINRIARSNEVVYANRLRGYGITQSQHPYILLICREPGIPQEKISREICVNKSSVTRQITILEEKGLIVRKQDQTDRRVWRVYPTQRMQELLTQQGRKDHVAGSKKDGEQHEGRIDYLGDCQFLFHLDSRSSQKVFCVYLSIFYAICQESHLKFCIF